MSETAILFSKLVQLLPPIPSPSRLILQIHQLIRKPKPCSMLLPLTKRISTKQKTETLPVRPETKTPHHRTNSHSTNPATYRTNRAARLSCLDSLHGTGICKLRPLTLYFRVSTTGRAFRSARFANAAGYSILCATRRCSKQLSIIRSDACIFPSFIIIRASLLIASSRKWSDISTHTHDRYPF